MKLFGIAAYLGLIVAANYVTTNYGLISVGFGYMATAGTYFAGLAFAARDLVQRQAGREWVLAAIVGGAFLSWFISPAFAVASGIAFLVSELADMAVYTPLMSRRPYLSVLLSNTVGAVADSFLFLWLAFGSVAFWEGQVIGKTLMILPALLALALWRNRALPLRVRARLAAA